MNCLASSLTARPFAGAPVRARASATRSAGRAAVVSVSARDAPYAPGTTAPAYLDGSLPGDFGYDPLGLGSDPILLAKFRENELMNGRWAMLGAAGMLAVELAGQGNWIDAPVWAVSGGSPTYLGNSIGVSDPTTLAVIELATMGFAEKMRGDATPEKRMYPGGTFDPMGLAKGDMKELQTKEIKNGRLAMVACVGFWSAGAVFHEGPIALLSRHLANPWAANCATNGISVPFANTSAFAMGSDVFWKAALPPMLL